MPNTAAQVLQQQTGNLSDAVRPITHRDLPACRREEVSEHDKSRHHHRGQTHFSEQQAIPSDGTTVNKTNESQGVNPRDDSSDECRQEDEAHITPPVHACCVSVQKREDLAEDADRLASDSSTDA
ncbi:hypothetical protein CDV31_013930 [Fusarium ambrosium]|uniref:Uncharacterized protein n=1 Tax=Fusarium ambrosium TaxID=131363 RepID=A0A428SZV7_9HYPO|nr:hypothetical protein CDV31_013930 [Fusarium ambrosium]